jgi:hypothetical protein
VIKASKIIKDRLNSKQTEPVDSIDRETAKIIGYVQDLVQNRLQDYINKPVQITEKEKHFIAKSALSLVDSDMSYIAEIPDKLFEEDIKKVHQNLSNSIINKVRETLSNIVKEKKIKKIDLNYLLNIIQQYGDYNKREEFFDLLKKHKITVSGALTENVSIRNIKRKLFIRECCKHLSKALLDRLIADKSDSQKFYTTYSQLRAIDQINVRNYRLEPQSSQEEYLDEFKEAIDKYVYFCKNKASEMACQKMIPLVDLINCIAKTINDFLKEDAGTEAHKIVVQKAVANACITHFYDYDSPITSEDNKHNKRVVETSATSGIAGFNAPFTSDIATYDPERPKSYKKLIKKKKKNVQH